MLVIIDIQHVLVIIDCFSWNLNWCGHGIELMFPWTIFYILYNGPCLDFEIGPNDAGSRHRLSECMQGQLCIVCNYIVCIQRGAASAMCVPRWAPLCTPHPDGWWVTLSGCCCGEREISWGRVPPPPLLLLAAPHPVLAVCSVDRRVQFPMWMCIMHACWIWGNSI